jgi:hypothetical protein
VYRCTVNLLVLPLDSADFFVKHSGMSLEIVVTDRMLTVELGVVPPPGGSTILSFLLGHS